MDEQRQKERLCIRKQVSKENNNEKLQDHRHDLPVRRHCSPGPLGRHRPRVEHQLGRVLRRRDADVHLQRDRQQRG